MFVKFGDGLRAKQANRHGLRQRVRINLNSKSRRIEVQYHQCIWKKARFSNVDLTRPGRFSRCKSPAPRPGRSHNTSPQRVGTGQSKRNAPTIVRLAFPASTVKILSMRRSLPVSRRRQASDTYGVKSRYRPGGGVRLFALRVFRNATRLAVPPFLGSCFKISRGCKRWTARARGNSWVEVVKRC